MEARAVLAYGALALPLSFAALPLYVLVPRLYADLVGLELALLGAILLGTRLLDAGIDPWLGWLADRVPRPAMVAACLLPFALGFVALLHPPVQAGPDWAALWLAGALALTCLGFSGASIAHQAWGADAGATPGERTRLSAAREGCALAGVLLAALAPTLLAGGAAPGPLAGEPTAGAATSLGTQRLAWLLLPLLLLASLATFRLGARPAVQPSGPAEAPWPALRAALANRPLRRLLMVAVANGVAAALPATLFLFFVADVLGREAAGGPLLALYFVAGAASLPLWVRAAARWGRVRAWLAGMALAMAGFAGAGALGPGDLPAFAAICLAAGLALGADLALPVAIAADLGERLGRAGACFGLWNLVAKLNLALAAGLALPLLGLLGYRPGSGEGLQALSLAYALAPLAFKALAAALLWRWRHSLETPP